MKWTLLLTVLCILYVVDCKRKLRKARHGRRNSKQLVSHDKYFAKIAKHVEAADRLIKNLCLKNNMMVSEEYEKFGYVIVYSIEGVDSMDIDVKIRNRVLYTAVRQGVGTWDDFLDARVLPRILKLHEAVWWTMYNELKVMIPYDVQFGDEVPGICAYSTSIFTVPRTTTIIDIR